MNKRLGRGDALRSDAAPRGRPMEAVAGGTAWARRGRASFDDGRRLRSVEASPAGQILVAGIAGPSRRHVTALTGDGWGYVRQLARALTTPRVEPWPSPAGPRVSTRARASMASWVRTFTVAAGPRESAGARRHPRQFWDSLDVSATGMASLACLRVLEGRRADVCR